MSKLKLLVPLAFAVVMFAPVTATFASSGPTMHLNGGGIYPPGPLGTHWNAGFNAPSIPLFSTMAASTTTDIVSQLSGATDEVRNGVGILVGIAAVALGVILGSVLAVTWLPRLVRRYFPRSG